MESTENEKLKTQSGIGHYGTGRYTAQDTTAQVAMALDSTAHFVI